MKTPRFDRIVGTGGIGTGILFELDGNRPLSRNETRLARLSPTRDYCKQHIILHYIARILSPEVQVYPIGMVGADSAGDALLAQMRAAGMDVRFVGRSAQKPTMYCVCMQYPDKAVCNVTTSDSACALVSGERILQALEALERPLDARTLIVAAPEVPVEARLTLLKRGKAAGAYCVSSCLVDEFADFTAGGGMQCTDLLVINEDEAAAFCGCSSENMEQRAMQCQVALLRENPQARSIMTCGARGSYACEGGKRGGHGGRGRRLYRRRHLRSGPGARFPAGNGKAVRAGTGRRALCRSDLRGGHHCGTDRPKHGSSLSENNVRTVRK